MFQCRNRTLKDLTAIRVRPVVKHMLQEIDICALALEKAYKKVKRRAVQVTGNSWIFHITTTKELLGFSTRRSVNLAPKLGCTQRWPPNRNPSIYSKVLLVLQSIALTDK